MNKAIAHILKEQLLDIPVIEKFAGLVSVAEYQETQMDAATNTIPKSIVKKVPYSDDVSDSDNCGETDLVPDSNKKGILYFEDLGTKPTGMSGQYSTYTSRLRLVCWFNTAYVATVASYSVAPVLINYILQRFSQMQMSNVSNFLSVQITVDNIPKLDKQIFSAYTFDLDSTQYLMKPYDFFALDLSVSYKIHPSCFDQLSLNTNLDICQ